MQQQEEKRADATTREQAEPRLSLRRDVLRQLRQPDTPRACRYTDWF